MKVQFSKEVEYIPAWNGNDKEKDPIKVILSPMEMEDFLSLMDSIQSAGVAEIDPEQASSSGNMTAFKELVKAAGHLIPKYTKLSGLTDENGNEISADEIVKYTFFIELSVEVLTALSNASMPTKEDEKN